MHPKTRTPVFITATFGVLIATLAAFVPLTEIVKLVNIGTLFAFVLVNIGVIILRRTRPDLERGFRVPFVPVFPIIGVILCFYLMLDLERDTWLRFVVLARDRHRHLLRLRAPPLAPAPGRGRQPRGRARPDRAELAAEAARPARAAPGVPLP